MTRVRLAILGAGVMGRKHAETIASSADCSLVGICDVDPARRTLADECGVPFYQDVTQLLERERPDGALIATPNAEHADGAALCARYGVHALIEKPIAGTLEDAQRIIEVADDAGIRVLVGHHRRHSPRIAAARALVQGGTLGRLVGVSVLWTLLKPSDYYTVDWRCRRPAGGPILINLIHELDSLRFICGELRQVYAQTSSAVRELEVEDSLSMALSFENGALATVLASDVTPSPWSYEATAHENPLYFPTDENCYHFFGTLGALAFPRMEIWSYANGNGNSSGGGNGNGMGWQCALERSRRDVAGADPLASQLRHFCRVVRGEEEPLVDGRDGARSLAAALAVLESARLAAPVLV